MTLLRTFASKIFQSDSRTALAARQIIYTLGIRSVGLLISFLYVPLLISSFEKERYGIWLAILSIVNWFTLFDIGLGNGLRNKLTECLAVKNFVLARRYISTTYVFVTGIFGSVLVLFQLINPFLDWNKILRVDAMLSDELYWLTTLVFSSFLLNFILQTTSIVYQSIQRPFIVSLYSLLSNLTSFALTYCLVSVGVSDMILLACVITFIPVAFNLILTFVSFNNRLKYISPSLEEIDCRLMRGIMQLGVKFFLIRISSLVIFASTSFLIIRLSGPVEVVYYEIAFKYFSIPILVNAIALAPIWASVTDAYAKKDFYWLKLTLVRLNWLSLLFIVFILVMIVLSEYVYGLWVAGVKVPFALTLLLGAYAIINTCLSPYSSFINGLGKVKLSALLSMVWIVLFLVIVFTASRSVSSSLAVAFALTITSLLGAGIQAIQTQMIIRQSAAGIWNQ